MAQETPCPPAAGWNELRQRMPVAGRWAYFDHAAVAPLSAPARRAIREYADDLAANGDVHWNRWRGEVEAARRLGAELLAAETDEIALVHNTSEGIDLVAEGFPWQAGDNVVLPAGEFPANRYPWLNLRARGVEVREVPVENDRLERLDDACDARTRIVAASWVDYATGWRNDPSQLAEIAHRHGALLFLDAIQGLGVFPLDVQTSAVDFLAADGHKWLLGPEGAGLFYCRREHLERLRPVHIGWNSVRDPGDFSAREMTLAPTAARYEGGSFALAGIAGFAASLRMLLGYGVQAISERLLTVTDRLCERLEANGAEIVSDRTGARRSGIVAFRTPGEEPPQETRRRLAAQGVVVNCRGGHLRASPHAYANDDDIDRLVRGLRER